MKDRFKETFKVAMQIQQTRSTFITMIVATVITFVFVFAFGDKRFGIYGSMACAMFSVAECQQFLRYYAEILKEYDEENGLD
jgi:nicotinamide riboside transporter PnuC